MPIENTTTDSHGRVVLPESFANARVTVEPIGEDVVVIRKATAALPEDEPEDEPTEEWPEVAEARRSRLSPADTRIILEMMDNPPEPNEALRQAMARRRPG